jgi:hypothetical protein
MNSMGGSVPHSNPEVLHSNPDQETNSGWDQAQSWRCQSQLKAWLDDGLGWFGCGLVGSRNPMGWRP